MPINGFSYQVYSVPTTLKLNFEKPLFAVAYDTIIAPEEMGTRTGAPIPIDWF
jgi:hypothetical protein